MASVLIALLQSAAGAQQPAIAYDVHEAMKGTLREIAASQAAFHSAHGRFAPSLAELSYRAPKDQAVVIAGSDSTGWSVVATHRMILGVRCALVEGTASPVLRDHRVSGGPACEGKVQLLRLNQEAPFGIGTSLLEQNPIRMNCASTETRASVPFAGRVMIEFLVDNHGIIQGRRFRVIQSPSLHHTFAALATLMRCRARPAEYQGRRIESLRRLAINLTSSGGPIPADSSGRQASAAIEYHGSTPLALLNLLRAVSQDQSKFKRRHGRYAASYFDLDRPIDRTGAAPEVVIVSAGRSGWSGIAWDQEEPEFSCSVVWDDAPAVGSEPSGRYRCQGIIPDTTNSRLPGEEAEVTRPPAYTRCDGHPGNRGLRGHATLQFVVDREGRPEPLLRVVDATDFSLIPHALYVISTCDYSPGFVKDQAVRVLVQQRINFN